jgi:ankyrin repeat protein
MCAGSAGAQVVTLLASAMPKVKSAKKTRPGISAAEFRASCATNSDDYVSKFINKGGDVNDPDPQGNTGLALAVQSCAVTVVGILLNTPGIKVDAENCRKIRPIHRACGGVNVVDDPKIVQMLAAAGADPTARSGVGWTPLHYAMFWGNVSIVSFLLTLDPVVQDFVGNVDAVPHDVLLGRLGVAEVLTMLPGPSPV